MKFSCKTPPSLCCYFLNCSATMTAETNACTAVDSPFLYCSYLSDIVFAMKTNQHRSSRLVCKLYEYYCMLHMWQRFIINTSSSTTALSDNDAQIEKVFKNRYWQWTNETRHSETVEKPAKIWKAWCTLHICIGK